MSSEQKPGKSSRYTLARNQIYVLRRKYPFEYELSPESLEKGTRWLTVRLKNIGNDVMHNMDINMHSTDSLQISFASRAIIYSV